MREENPFVRMLGKKKYRSYAGEIMPTTPDFSHRNYKVEKPNMKWLTDITAFRIPAGKVYLLAIINCFDVVVVSWMISTEPIFCFIRC